MGKFGRKPAVIYAAVVCIFGGTLSAASQNVAMFIVSRFFAGAGAWSFLTIST